MSTVAIMQPYFLPYMGYFRLFEKSDLFVVMDCVQFPRRGFVHRNKFWSQQHVPSWLTLPIKKQPQDVLINQLTFHPDANRLFFRQIQKFDCFKPYIKLSENELSTALFDFTTTPLEYNERLLEIICRKLGLHFNVVRSSALGLSGNCRGQDKIIEIMKLVGGKIYLNSPGGKKLYDNSSFARAGLELRFLENFQGEFISCIEASSSLLP